MIRNASLLLSLVCISCGDPQDVVVEDQPSAAELDKLANAERIPDVEPITPASPEPVAWAPDRAAIPLRTAPADHQHAMVMTWALADSFTRLVDTSRAAVYGQVVSRRYDALRPVDGADDSSDMAVTRVRVRIDRVLFARADSRARDGAPLAPQREVEIIFPGGLLSDGCVIEPVDNPLPPDGERGAFFLADLGDAPIVGERGAGVFHLATGIGGRLREHDGVLVPLVPETGIRLQAFDGVAGKPVGALAQRVAQTFH